MLLGETAVTTPGLASCPLDLPCLLQTCISKTFHILFSLSHHILLRHSLRLTPFSSISVQWWFNQHPSLHSICECQWWNVQLYRLTLTNLTHVTLMLMLTDMVERGNYQTDCCVNIMTTINANTCKPIKLDQHTLHSCTDACHICSTERWRKKYKSQFQHTYRKEAKNSWNPLTKDKHHNLTIHQRSDPSSMTQNFLQNFNNIHNY